jgi:hypothetical protein
LTASIVLSHGAAGGGGGAVVHACAPKKKFNLKKEVVLELNQMTLLF